MIQDNFTLLLSFLIFTFLLSIYFYRDSKKVKNANRLHFDLIYNQIAKEKILKEHYRKESVEFEKTKEGLNQKLLHLRTDINTIEHTLNEIFKSI